MSGQVVWIVAFLLYVYDSISTNNREAVLRYSLEGVTAAIAEPALVVGGHRIFIPNPLRPDHCDLLLNRASLAGLSRLDRYFIERGSSVYVVHQIVAVGTLLVLFVGAPLLATRMSLLHAILMAVGATFWLCGFHWIAMWKNRRLLGIDGKALRKDMLHVLLCPPNAVNSVRRIAAHRHLRYGVLPTLRAFSCYEAERYVEQFQPLRANP